VSEEIIETDEMHDWLAKTIELPIKAIDRGYPDEERCASAIAPARSPRQNCPSPLKEKLDALARGRGESGNRCPVQTEWRRCHDHQTQIT
jgi:hypothetical protein